MEALRISMWRSRYRVTDQGREITTWDSSTWRTGGDFVLDGRRFQVRANGWGNKYTMTDDSGAVLATADRVGRKRWTVEAGGQTYHFQRRGFWGNEEELVLGDTVVGSVRRTSLWRGDVAVELPGLPREVQVFTLGVVISKWDAAAAAAAAS